MPPSLLNERYKMLFSFLIVLNFFSAIETESIKTLVDLPLEIPSKGAKLHATLSDSNGSNKYFIKEFISASNLYIHGRIEISGEKDSFSIHYNNDPRFKSSRLVIHGNDCSIYSFKNDWDKTLPGISKPVINFVLLMGPSILYRLGHSSLVWEKVPDKNIRGTMMKGASTEINNKRLKITHYYKKHFDDDVGIKNPSRIEFRGYDPYSTSYDSSENLILDIYLQNENDYDKLENQFQPLPGIGCPNLFIYSSPPVPRLKTDYVHYTMYERIQGSTTSQTFSEIHASEKVNVVRVKANLLGITTEAIYDYQLGVSYILETNGYCNIFVGDLNSPGVDSAGHFNLDRLLLIDEIDSYFRYLGKLNFEHRSGFPVDAWETVKYDCNINGKKVDKAVITQYFTKSPNSEIFRGYTLVSTKIVIYKLESSKKTYSLVDEITRDYMNLKKAGSEDDLHDVFSLKDCNRMNSDKRITLGFKLQNQGDRSTEELTKSHIYQFIQDFQRDTILSKNISPLRIDNIEYNFNEEQDEIEVTFLDTPDLKSIYNFKTMFVSTETFIRMPKTSASNEFECLDKISKYEGIIAIRSDFFCGYLQNIEYLKEDTKAEQPCSVYHFPLKNLRRIGQEIPLDRVHNTFLQDIGKSFFLISGNTYTSVKPYTLVDVIDKTKNQVASDFLSLARVETKIHKNDQVTKDVPDVKILADCYRTCHDSEQLACNILSFCVNGDTVECRVSSLTYDDMFIDGKSETAKNCSVYSLTVLNDYSEVPRRKFKSLTSIATEHGIYTCAEYCHASPDCLSFQFCDNSCSFGGFYTDSATEYDEGCSVYFPKVSQKYKKTGNKIVSEVIYTEINVNLEQCALLCHGWSDGETGCQSFNYCPKSKTESSCSLTKFSVKNGDTKTIDGGECSNYEIKEKSKDKKNKESNSSKVIKGTSGSGAFGIIVLFLFVGGLIGFVAPFAYKRVKHMRVNSEANENFTWSKQVDESAENIS